MVQPLRILVVGAGAIGGYFGGRLLAAGRDVTFLVRPARRARLAHDGLRIISPRGDLHLANPPCVSADDLNGAYDLVLLACKAYDLDAAMQDIAGAVGKGTSILPLLNGLRHLDALDERFGAARVLGGQCVISSTLDPAGTILHLNDQNVLTFGERDGSRPEWVAAIGAMMAGAGFEARVSETILLDMWEKFVFLATLAGITCLMRAPIGDIVAAGGTAATLALLEEARATAEAEGYPPRPAFLDRARAMLTAAGSSLAASMLRDIEHGAAIEAEQVLGDLLRRHEKHLRDGSFMLLAAHVHVAAYEARRMRAP